MSWHCSAGAGVDFSLPDYLAGLQLRRSKSSPTAATLSSNGKGMGPWKSSPSGTTLPPSTANRGQGLLTSSLLASRVSPMELWFYPNGDFNPSNLWLLEIKFSLTEEDGEKLRQSCVGGPIKLLSSGDMDFLTSELQRNILSTFVKTSGNGTVCHAVTLGTFSKPVGWKQAKSLGSQPTLLVKLFPRNPLLASSRDEALTFGGSSVGTLLMGGGSKTTAKEESSSAVDTMKERSSNRESGKSITVPCQKNEPQRSSTFVAKSSTTSLNNSERVQEENEFRVGATPLAKNKVKDSFKGTCQETGARPEECGKQQRSVEVLLWALVYWCKEPGESLPPSTRIGLLRKPRLKKEKSDKNPSIKSSSRIGTVVHSWRATTDGSQFVRLGKDKDAACGTSQSRMMSPTWLTGVSSTTARTYRRPGKGWAFEPASVRDYGEKLHASLKSAGLRLSSLKIPLAWSIADWISSYWTLPAWGMTHGGECWGLGTSVEVIGGTASLYWPTPVKAQTCGGEGGREMLVRLLQQGILTEKETRVLQGTTKVEWVRPSKLKKVVQKLYMPTPCKTGGRSEGQLEMWIGLVDAGHMTVQQAEEMAGGTLFQPCRKGKKFDRPDLKQGSGKRRKLFGINPEWLESLMSWPPGWSDVKPLAMDKFHKWLRSHF